MKTNYKVLLQLILISMIFMVFSSPARAQTIVCLELNIGQICMELTETEAPVTAQNFLAYVNQGSYRNSFFHLRESSDGNYIQAGEFADTGAGGLDGLQQIFKRSPISNETGVSNIRGTVALVPDDPNNPDSATSQFLINIDDNASVLDNKNGGYTVFARIIGDGLELVDLMAALPVIGFNNSDLSKVPVVGQEVPIENSIRINILDATIYDGDITDFENDNNGGGDSGGDGGGDNPDNGGGDGGTDTPTPGEGQTLYEDAVCVDTNVGEFCMELLDDIAPITVTNFLNYVNSGRYDDTIVHRSVPNFVIQGGGYLSSPLGSAITKDAAIQNEFNRSNLRGTVAMARLGGVVNSATSEWFVNLVNNTQLNSVDGGFTVFGQIISGMSVVDSIGTLPRSNQQTTLGSPFGELPLSDQDSDGVQADDLVLVHRIYVTDVIVDDNDAGSGGGDNGGGDGGGNTVETTAAYSASTGSFTMPVKIGEELYRVFMFQDTDAAGIVFSVDTTKIISLNDVGQERATMNLDTGVLVIPSVSVNNIVITDVTFNLTDFATLTFKLESYNRP